MKFIYIHERDLPGLSILTPFRSVPDAKRAFSIWKQEDSTLNWLTAVEFDRELTDEERAEFVLEEEATEVISYASLRG
jgi:hypothetical protein